MSERKSVTNLKGIGESTEEKWKEKGIDSLQTLASKKPEELASILDIDEGKAKRYMTEAKSIIQEDIVVIKTAKEILEFQQNIRQFISTGSSKLDEILGGGVQTACMTLIAGKSGVGKTQIAHQCTVNCVHDVNRKVLYIATEPNSLIVGRLMQMSLLGKNKSLNIGEDVFVVSHENFDLPEDRLDEIPDKMYRAYGRVEECLEKGEDIGLLVLDSFVAPLRKVFLGRETLYSRSKVLGKHIGYLQRLQSKYNLAVLLTSQVYGSPDDSYEELRRFGIYEHIWGGEFFIHSVTYGLSLDLMSGGKKTDEVWEGYLFKAPDLPRRRARFILTKEGVRDE